MRRLLLAALLFTGKLTMAQQSVSIKGVVTNLDNHKLAIVYNNGTKKVRDTIAAINGIFAATLNITEVQEISISPYSYFNNAIKQKRSNSYIMAPALDLLVAPGDQLELNGDAMKIWETDVKGGTYTAGYKKYAFFFVPALSEDRRLTALMTEAENNGDTTKAAEIKTERVTKIDKIRALQKKFYTENTKDMYAMFKFSEAIYAMSTEEIEKVYASYSNNLQQSVFGKKVAGFLEKSKAVAVGKNIIDFTGTTLTGNAFNSKDLRNKYVLLDFWGSWCGPCRKSNPHLKELYSKYKNDGFEIVGIAQENGALDKSKAAWEGAVKTDGLTWIQLLNNQMKDNMDVVKAYNVNAFPTKILVDKNGVIVWKGVGDEETELDKKLESIFKK